MKDLTREQAIEEIGTFLDKNVDWDEVHGIIATLASYGESVCIHTDGMASLLGSNTHYRNYSHIVGSVYVGNWEYEYSQGWAEWVGDTTDTYRTEDGRILSYEGMILECIEEGDFSHFYDEWKARILKNYQEVDGGEDPIQVAQAIAERQKELREPIKL